MVDKLVLIGYTGIIEKEKVLSMSEIQSNSLSVNNLLNKLENFLTVNNFQVGDKLPAERALAEEFQVSRSSIRKALKKLVEKGVLESRQGDGNYLKTSHIEAIASEIIDAVKREGSLFEQVTEYRYYVEPIIGHLAALKRTEKQLNQLKLIVFEQQRRKSLGLPLDGKLDANFHLHLAKCTGNFLFVETIKRLNRIYSEGRSDEVRDDDWKEFSIKTHLQIIDAIEAQDAELCEKLLREHIATVMNNHIFSNKKSRV